MNTSSPLNSSFPGLPLSQLPLNASSAIKPASDTGQDSPAVKLLPTQKQLIKEIAGTDKETEQLLLDPAPIELEALPLCGNLSGNRNEAADGTDARQGPGDEPVTQGKKPPSSGVHYSVRHSDSKYPVPKDSDNKYAVPTDASDQSTGTPTSSKIPSKTPGAPAKDDVGKDGVKTLKKSKEVFDGVMKVSAWIATRETVSQLLAMAVTTNVSALMRSLVHEAMGDASDEAKNAVVQSLELGINLALIYKMGVQHAWKNGAAMTSKFVGGRVDSNQGRKALTWLPAVLSVGAAAAVGLFTGNWHQGADVLNRQTTRALFTTKLRDFFGKVVTDGVGPGMKIVPNEGTTDSVETQKEKGLEADKAKNRTGLVSRLVGSFFVELGLRPALNVVKTGTASNRPFFTEPGVPMAQEYSASYSNELTVGALGALATFVAAFAGNMATAPAALRLDMSVEYTEGKWGAQLKKNITELFSWDGWHQGWKKAGPDNFARSYITGLTGAMGDALPEMAPGKSWSLVHPKEGEVFATIAAVWRMLSKLPMEYRSNMAKTGGVAAKEMLDVYDAMEHFVPNFEKAWELGAEIGKLRKEITKLSQSQNPDKPGIQKLQERLLKLELTCQDTCFAMREQGLSLSKKVAAFRDSYVPVPDDQKGASAPVKAALAEGDFDLGTNRIHIAPSKDKNGKADGYYNVSSTSAVNAFEGHRLKTSDTSSGDRIDNYRLPEKWLQGFWAETPATISKADPLPFGRTETIEEGQFHTATDSKMHVNPLAGFPHAVYTSSQLISYVQGTGQTFEVAQRNGSRFDNLEQLKPGVAVDLTVDDESAHLQGTDHLATLVGTATVGGHTNLLEVTTETANQDLANASVYSIIGMQQGALSRYFIRHELR